MNYSGDKHYHGNYHSDNNDRLNNPCANCLFTKGYCTKGKEGGRSFGAFILPLYIQGYCVTHSIDTALVNIEIFNWSDLY